MTMPTPAGIEVSPPPVEPYRYGLLAAAQIVPEPDVHWEGQGVVYRADGCGPTGGIWLNPCDTPAPGVDLEAFRVELSKAAGGDVLVATLISRDGRYSLAPVTVTVAGQPQVLGAVEDAATWTLTPATTVPITVAIPATGVGPACSSAIDFPVPATDTTGSAQMPCVVRLDGDRPDQVKTISAGAEFIAGKPFIVYETASCYAQGFPEAEANALAERRMALHEQWWVEFRTWFSILSEQFEVINPGGTANPVPLSLLDALGQAEDLIADRYGGLGTIHVPRQYYAYLRKDALIRRDGPRLRTELDNVVSIGAGYSPVDPRNGQTMPIGQGWIYITGPVIARRSEIQTRQHFEHRRNERLVIVERSYALTTDCLRLAVLVQFEPTPISQGGG